MPKKEETKVSPKNIKPAVKTTTKEAGLSVAVYGMDGVKKGNISLSKEVFGAKVNENLMLQALRVYMVNQRQGTAEVKTRGEVSLTTAKWYRQKGTGRARHGAKSAPIFVGGGVAFGPRKREFDLKLSKQMRKKALFSALSSKLSENKFFVIDGAAATGKTAEVAKALKKMSINGNVLFVATENIARAAKNIDGVVLEAPHSINTYEVVKSNFVVADKSAIEKLEKTFVGGDK